MTASLIAISSALMNSSQSNSSGRTVNEAVVFPVPLQPAMIEIWHISASACQRYDISMHVIFTILTIKTGAMIDKRSKIFSYTAGELIVLLKEYPKDMPVIVSGYENGYENFYHPTVQKVTHLPDNMYWDGEFQVDENGIDVLVLERVERND